jgi:hypothetical protein
MPVENFHGVITPAEMERALKYKLVSWYSLPSDVLTSLIYRVSTLLLIIYNGALQILLNLYLGILSCIPNCIGFASYGHDVSNHAIMLDFPCLSTRLLLPETLQYVHIKKPWWRVMSPQGMRQRPCGLVSRISP